MRGIGLTISGFLGAIFVNYSGLGVIWIFASIAYTVADSSYVWKEHFKNRYFNVCKRFYATHKNCLPLAYFIQLFFVFDVCYCSYFCTRFSSLTIWTPLLKIYFSDHAFGYLLN